MFGGKGSRGRYTAEIAANVAVIVLVPVVARMSMPAVGSAFTASGLGRLWAALSGGGGFTDVGGAMLSAYGLWSRNLTAYQPPAGLDQFGVGAYGLTGHTHAPTSVVLGVPLLALDYRWWISFWIVASACAIAVTMRTLSVPGWVAYPVAFGMCLTGSGNASLMTTYPVSALLIALAWRFRGRTGVSGLALGLITAERGIGGILLLDPIMRRRWRTVAVAAALVAALLVLAVIIEPHVIHEFLTTGRDSLAANLSKADLYTPYAIFTRRGLPVWLLAGMLTAWAVFAWWRGTHQFWALVWLTAAIAPLAWHYSAIQLLPLAVVTWRSGSIGRAVSIVVGFAVFGQFSAAVVAENLGWTVAVVLLGLAIVVQPVERGLVDGLSPSVLAARFRRRSGTVPELVS